MAIFFVSVDNGPQYRIEASDSFAAWDKVIDDNPEAEWIEVAPAWAMPANVREAAERLQ